jgi:DNA-binding HxlR family transcriptional regulator
MKNEKLVITKNCPVTKCMQIIGGKWKTIIIYLISIEINRFGQLQRSCEGISKQMLTKQLRELEKDGIINRKIYAEIPPRVEYSITPKGETLFPILESMEKWGLKNDFDK